ncbi:MAG: hypothetical protein GTO03_14850, partial [Planctomycetales bacterium]|nr:hypothetical protein [Planctomycetales bacterium]
MRGFSRLTDVLLADRELIGSSLELADYGSWLRHVHLLARPATPIWVQLHSDYPPTWRRQLAALAGPSTAPAEVGYSQLRQQVLLAIAQGARGLCFSSRAPLNADSGPARRRALALELINLELQLLEPWAAAGQVATPANSNQPTFTGAVLHSERGRLLLPLRTAGGMQYVAAAAPQEAAHFLVPGVPASNRSYLMTLASLEPLPQRRVTGGNQVTLEKPDRLTAILITEDPVVVDRLAETIQRMRRRASELQSGLAAEELARVEEVEHQLAKATGGEDREPALQPVRQRVQQGQSALAVGDTGQAALHSAAALSGLDRVRRHSWNTAIGKLGHPSQLPLLAAYATLPLAYDRTKALLSVRWGENRLAGGEMEDLEEMLAAGWRHVRLADDPLASQVELSPIRPHGGRRSLHLRVGRGEELAPEFVEAPPLWIVSSPIPLQAGQIVRIQGWAWVPEPVTATADGLLIFDSAAGPAMARRIGQTSGWQKFTLYRAATATGPMSLTFALA